MIIIVYRQNQPDHTRQQRPVDRADVDLPALVCKKPPVKKA